MKMSRSLLHPARFNLLRQTLSQFIDHAAQSMRISFVMPSNSHSGGMRVIGIFADGLRARGHDVFLLSQPYPQLSTKKKLRALVTRGTTKRRKRSGPFLDHLADVHRVLERNRAVTDADLPDADVVIATWWQTAFSVASLAPSKGTKVYFMQDYGAPGQELEKVAPTWKLPLSFITLTEGLRAQIMSANPKARVRVVQNAVDLEKFTSPARLKPTRPTFGLLYRPQASKGIDVALNALARARCADRLKLVAYGTRPRFEEAEGMPFEIDYRCSPTDAEVRQIYSQCSAWLFPSRLEGYGLPISEAMACRTPVIGTRAGAGPDLIRSRENGHLVDIEDAAAMADAIDAIAEMPPMDWSAMSEAAYATVKDYTWDDATDAFEAALLQAVSDN